MLSDLENKVNETLPAVKEDNELAKLVNETSAIERGINGFVFGCMITMFGLNFNLEYARENDKQIERMYLIPRIYTNSDSGVIGLLLGSMAWVGAEALILTASFYTFGLLGLGTYFGAKKFTNYLGEKHYKKQRQKHERLENFHGK